jgi:hypothetical protein
VPQPQQCTQALVECSVSQDKATTAVAQYYDCMYLHVLN